MSYFDMTMMFLGYFTLGRLTGVVLGYAISGYKRRNDR